MDQKDTLGNQIVSWQRRCCLNELAQVIFGISGCALRNCADGRTVLVRWCDADEEKRDHPSGTRGLLSDVDLHPWMALASLTIPDSLLYTQPLNLS